MFQISDFINKHEFVAKLNKLISFDGKYSSLKDIPTAFPPKEHSHSVVNENSEPNSLGFISNETYQQLKKNLEVFAIDSSYIWNSWNSFEKVNLLGVIPFFSEKISANIYYQEILCTAQEQDINIDPFKNNVIDIFFDSQSFSLYEFSLVMGIWSNFCAWDSSDLDVVKKYIDYKTDFALFVPITFKLEVPCNEVNIDLKTTINITDEKISRAISTNRINFGIDRTCFLVNTNHDLFVMGSEGDLYSNHLLHILPDETYSCSQSRSLLFIEERRTITIQTLLEYRPNMGSYHKLRVLNVS